MICYLEYVNYQVTDLLNIFLLQKYYILHLTDFRWGGCISVIFFFYLVIPLPVLGSLLYLWGSKAGHTLYFFFFAEF